MMNAAEFHRRMAEVEKPNQALAALPPLIRHQPIDALNKHRAFLEKVPPRQQADTQRLLSERYGLIFEGVDH